MRIIAWMAAVLAATFPSSAAAQDLLRPYTLASEQPGTVEQVAAEIEEKLTEAGFRVVGNYAPVEDAKVLAITSDPLATAAASSDFGGYAAAQRVSITAAGDQVQVAFTNPVYLGHLYRLEADLSEIRQHLKSTLGFVRDYGSKKGMTREKLRKYHYMAMMPYFDDQFVLAIHDDHPSAVAAVRAALSANLGGTTKVYEVAIPGKDEVVFGVAQWEGKGADAHVLKNCDLQPDRMTAYGPYELLVSGNEVRTLHGRFRIALAFPDLTMARFMKIVGAPPAIKDTMATLAQGVE